MNNPSSCVIPFLLFSVVNVDESSATNALGIGSGSLTMRSGSERRDGENTNVHFGFILLSLLFQKPSRVCDPCAAEINPAYLEEGEALNDDLSAPLFPGGRRKRRTRNRCLDVFPCCRGFL